MLTFWTVEFTLNECHAKYIQSNGNYTVNQETKKKFEIVFSEGCTSEIANLGKQTFNMMQIL